MVDTARPILQCPICGLQTRILIEGVCHPCYEDGKLGSIPSKRKKKVMWSEEQFVAYMEDYFKSDKTAAKFYTFRSIQNPNLPSYSTILNFIACLSSDDPLYIRYKTKSSSGRVRSTNKLRKK